MHERKRSGQTMPGSRLTVRVLWYEAAAFAILLALLWANELLDLPYRLGSPPTPANWLELAMESTALVAVGILSLLTTRSLLRKIRHLEGFLHICSFCKRVHVGDRWVPIESYVRDHADVDFSHGLCPECVRQHYGLTLSEEPAGRHE
jgi:hypothetical protein